METYLNLMLIRFGLLAGGAVMLALALFAVAVVLRRMGKGEQVRRVARPAIETGLRALARRLEGRAYDRRPGDGS